MLGVGRGVVDAVADHQHLPAGLFHLPHRAHLVLREQSGADVGDALYDNLRLGVRDVRAERPVGASAD
ncbi:hypothetical protein ACFCYB_30515 [Streptomyces sp. NPDC056309]|uniref:hypothetical protein n=1 Tax=unclassified Streptomyces TaxID=2593676 RepID=UPI0035D69C94